MKIVQIAYIKIGERYGALFTNTCGDVVCVVASVYSKASVEDAIEEKKAGFRADVRFIGGGPTIDMNISAGG